MFLTNSQTVIIAIADNIIVNDRGFFQIGEVEYQEPGLTRYSIPVTPGYGIGDLYSAEEGFEHPPEPPPPEPPTPIEPYKREVLIAIFRKLEEIETTKLLLTAQGVQFSNPDPNGDNPNNIGYDDLQYEITGHAIDELAHLMMIASQGKDIVWHGRYDPPKTFKSSDFMVLYGMLMVHYYYHATYTSLLYEEIYTMTTVSEIQSVYYGQPLTAEHQAELDAIMQGLAK